MFAKILHDFWLMLGNDRCKEVSTNLQKLVIFALFCGANYEREPNRGICKVTRYLHLSLKVKEEIFTFKNLIVIGKDYPYLKMET